MGKVNKLGLVAALGVGLALTTAARADYVVSIESGGMNAIEVDASGGDVTVPVSVNLTRENGDEEVGTAIFDLGIDNGGLNYTGYMWNALFETDVPNDASDRPTINGATSLHFENLTTTGTNLFPEGTLVTLDLVVPGGTPEGETFNVSYSHDTLTPDGLFTFFGVTGSTGLAITTVPEPATLALLGIGGIAALRRRKKA